MNLAYVLRREQKMLLRQPLLNNNKCRKPSDTDNEATACEFRVPGVICSYCGLELLYTRTSKLKIFFASSPSMQVC